jgi:hypothetical protein
MQQFIGWVPSSAAKRLLFIMDLPMAYFMALLLKKFRAKVSASYPQLHRNFSGCHTSFDGNNLPAKAICKPKI